MISEQLEASTLSIRDKLEDEGIQARNLIKFNVPLHCKKKCQLMTSPDDKVSSSTFKIDDVNDLLMSDLPPDECGDGMTINNGSLQLSVSVSTENLNAVKLISSNSSDLRTSNINGKTSDYRARYWGQMMDTLKRTIDEIYSACETDESEVECKEVIMILEHSKKDFYSLIEKMNLFKEIENSKNESSLINDVSNKQLCIAWDERKISPGKPIMKQVLEKSRRTHSHSGQSSSTMSQTDMSVKSTKDMQVSTEMVVKETNDNKSQSNNESSNCTWADKVKFSAPVPEKKLFIKKVSEKPSNTTIKDFRNVNHHSNTENLSSKSNSSSTNHHCSLKPKLIESSNKTPKIDKSNTGEWETVCRTKLRTSKQTVKASHRNHTFSDRPSRRSMLKPNMKFNQNLKRNKSKSENNLDLSVRDRIYKISVDSSLSTNSYTVTKSYSSNFVIDHSENNTENVPSFRNYRQNSTFNGRPSYSDSKNVLKLSTNSVKKVQSAPHSKSTANKEEFDKIIIQNTSFASHLVQAETDNHMNTELLLFNDNGNNNNTMDNIIDNCSLENSTDETGDDDETSHNIRQLNKQLADVESTETQLQNELGIAQEEEKACREKIEQEEKAEINEVRNNSFSKEHSLQNLIHGESEFVMSLSSDDDDESDDGYDFVLNLNFGNSDSQTPTAFSSFADRKTSLSMTDWSEITDDKDQNELDDSITKLRTPGRCVEMHQKLSAPSRKRSINSIEQLEEKQAKAKDLREKLLLDRTERVRELTKKVEEVRMHKNMLLDEKKSWMEQRLCKAERKRQQQLDERVKKAHDEEMKGKEIAFIQSLEAAQKQHTILTKHQESEARLLERQEERKKRMEEKAEKEAAAESRRKKIETDRQAWLKDLQRRWKDREEELASKAENRERQRRDAVRAKEAEREMKKSVLEQQQKTHIEQLKEKILKKHEDSERRYQEQLAEISRKAFEMSVAKYSVEESSDAPAIEPYVHKKWCNLCNVMIDSDVLLQSHLNGKKHKTYVKEELSGDSVGHDQIKQFNLEHIIDAPDDKTDLKTQAKKERRKVVKKKIKKIKQRMITNTPEFDRFVEQMRDEKVHPHSANKQKIYKFVKDVRRYLSIQDSGPWIASRVQSTDKSISDLIRGIDKNENLELDQNSFLSLGGLEVLNSIVYLIQCQKSESTSMLPDKTLVLAFKCLRKMCGTNVNVCYYILHSAFIVNILDGLQTKLSFLVPDNFVSQLKKRSQSHGSPLANDHELCTNIVVEQILQTLTMIIDNYIIKNSSDCLYSPPYRISMAPSGRSSSMSTTSNKTDGKTVDNFKIQSILSYAISIGIIDKLSDYLSQIRGPLKENSHTAHFALIILSFLSSMLKILAFCSQSINGVSLKCHNVKFSPDDCLGNGDGLRTVSERNHFLISIEENEMCGLICLLYGLLLYQGNSDLNYEAIPPLTGKITIAGLKLINNLAVVSLKTMQTVLSQEGISLQLRHILSYLISYCTKNLSSRSSGNQIHDNKSSCSSVDLESFSISELLQEVILCVGYFCVNSSDNQNFVQTGQRPTILQQLCQLPFPYFSQKNLVQCLYPTLISCCYNNTENTGILELEMTCSLLSRFLQEKICTDETEKISSDCDSKFELQSRFPISEWKNAVLYFQR